MFTNTKQSFLSLVIALLSGVPLFLQSQEILHYEGEYQLGQYKGEASFNYVLVDTDTLFEGAFIMQRSNLQELLEQQDFSFLFDGNFKNGIPDGSWKIRFSEFTSGRESQVIDYEYRIIVSGVQEEVNGAMKSGKPDGQWVYSIDSIARSQVEKNLFKSTIEFEEGVPQRSFRIEKDGFTLVGRTLRNGLAHDQWSLYSTDGVSAIENWYFENGLLRKIEITADNRIDTIDFYPPMIENSQQVTIDDNYLKILKIKAVSRENPMKLRSALYALVAENANYYEKIEDILKELGPSELQAKFKVNVELYKSSDQEINILDSITTLNSKTLSVSESLLSNTQLNIIRLTDADAADLYEKVYQLSENIVKPTDRIRAFRENKVLEAVSRTELLNYIWSNTNSMTRPDQQLEEGIMYLQDNDLPFPPKDLNSVLELADYASRSIDSIQLALGTKLNIDQRQRDLIQIEDQLITQSKKINALVDSLKQETSGKVREALQYIKSLTNADLSKYSSLVDENEKLELGRQLLACQQTMEKLVIATAALPKQSEEIVQLYKDDIWNPHMAVIMVDDIKKRITTAYSKIIIPDLLQRLNTDLNCRNASNYLSLMNSIYQRMLEMREEDTSKLERRLKKEEDPVEILRLFKVEPNYTD